MKRLVILTVVFGLISVGQAKEKTTDEIPKNISSQTRSCLGCHNNYTPGLVKDWLSSRHARTTVKEGLEKPALARRISIDKPPADIGNVVIGCYECHSRNTDKHADSFSHFGHKINVVVSPPDCATCHPVEVKQYGNTKKAHAIKNLMGNPVYHALVTTVTGTKRFEKGELVLEKASASTLHETCLGCHGTKVEFKGMKKLVSNAGDIEISVPDLSNWPNQGVGRENPDGSIGACTACHPRHGFSIEVARKPYTCAQCHLEPDVPAWNVYKESKHGNIFHSKYHEWEFNTVPWVVGVDFKAPTCATCHNSLIVGEDGKVIVQRTHDFGERLWVRLFGLIYSHPQPKSGNTTVIRNKDGLPLPAAFTGELASEHLISKKEMQARMDVMKQVCNMCHNRDWINGHFAKLEATIKETDAMTKTATLILLDAWEKGIEDKTNPFDESIETMWIKQWLFYANTIRYASAMTGAPDYTSFKYGWWELSRNLYEMKDMKDLKDKLGKKKK